MARKKRIARGIKSIERQIELHEAKIKSALTKGDVWLAEYYTKEIERLRQDLDMKKRKLTRKYR